MNPEDVSKRGRKSSKCNRRGVKRSSKELSRRKPAKAFSGAGIDKVLNRKNDVIGDIKEIRALREEETDDVVCVFIGASLPGLVGLGKEDQSIEMFFKEGEIREFGAIVKADTVDRKAFEHINDSPAGFACIPV